MPATIVLNAVTKDYNTPLKDVVTTTVTFNPPASIAGKPCLVETVFASLESVTAAEQLLVETLFIGADISQPQSYNNNTGSANRIVAVLNKGYPGQSHPTIQMQMPSSSTEISLRVHGNITDLKTNFHITLVWNVTPIETLSP